MGGIAHIPKKEGSRRVSKGPGVLFDGNDWHGDIIYLGLPYALKHCESQRRGLTEVFWRRVGEEKVEVNQNLREISGGFYDLS